MLDREAARRLASVLRHAAKLLEDAADTSADLSRALLSGIQPADSIRELDLSVRARKVLARMGVHTIDQLVGVRADSIADQKHCGIVTIEEIRQKMAARGLFLKGEKPVDGTDTKEPK